MRCVLSLLAVVLSLFMGTNVPAQPVPGKSDTFAVDTHLRRSVHPLTVKLIPQAPARAVHDAPVTFGVGCGEGDYPVDRLCPVLNGRELPAQVDVLATWPADGSIRHALVTVIVPEIPARETVTLTFRQADPPTPPKFVLSASLNDWTAAAEFVGEDGSTVRSSIPAEVVERIREVLADKKVSGASSPSVETVPAGAGSPGREVICPRLAGPICYEFELHDVPVGDAGSDPDLDVFYRLRFYSGLNLAFWGMYPTYVWPHTGIVPGTARAAAWQLRNATDAAFLLPDDHERKQYLGEYVDRNLADMRRRLDERGHLVTGPRKCSGRQHWVCSGQTSIWQYTWLVWSLDNTARKGWPQSSQVRDNAADVLLRMYDGQEAFTVPNGKTYRFEFKGGMPYSLATDLIQVEYGDNGQEQDTLLRPISNTGEMYYYTLVNISNMHYFSDRQKQQAWIDSLPGKTMRPEDWRLDPAVEAKGTGGLSHEYGNSECSAALARYDNPRAQKMYDFVRKTIDEAPRPDYQPRFRGAEFVK